MKLKRFVKIDDNKQYVTYFGTDEVVSLPKYHFKEDEVRGIWVSNVVNIDTPQMKNKEEYQQYLKTMIERIASYNMNTIVFQVRPASDAYYPSLLNPWSRFITGTEGKDPGFDVLQFVIDEAAKYNIRVHAWMNPYRVSLKSLTDLNMTKEEYLGTLDALNFARRHPDCTILDGVGKIILKPASEEVIEFITETVSEIVNNYDVEGVHIDDYFYPYAKIDPQSEVVDYNAYCKRYGLISFDDWRRQNVDTLIKSINNALKKSFSKTGRKVLFGISPFGIYRTHASLKEGGWEKGSLHSPKALECYTDLFSDIYKWMKEGWIDYVVPQVYFPFERPDVTYHDLTKWWAEIVKETKTKLYIGQGLYQMGKSDYWQNPDEITNQLRFNQLFSTIKGTIFFTYHDLVPGDNPVKDEALNQLKAMWNHK